MLHSGRPQRRFRQHSQKIGCFLASAGVAVAGEDDEVKAVQLLRRMEVALVRENARAVARRWPAPSLPIVSASPEGWAETPSWQ